MGTKTWNGASADWTLAGDWTGGEPAKTDDAVINSGTVIVSTVVSDAGSALNSLTLGSGAAIHIGTGSLYVNTVANSSANFDLDVGAGSGGGGLTIKGVMTNSGALNFGNSSLSTATTIIIAAFNNSSGSTLGTLNLIGGPAKQLKVSLIQTASAGFDLLATGDLVGHVSLSGDSLLELSGDASFSTITTGSSLSLNGANAFVASARISTSSNSALTGLTSNLGTLDLENGAGIVVGGAFANSGTIELDASSGAASSSLSILNGALTNTGKILFGNLAGAPVLNAGFTVGSLNNTGGTLTLVAGASVANPAQMFVSGAAMDFGGGAGVIEGAINLTGRSQITFEAPGQFTTIDANSSLTLSGGGAQINSLSNSSQGSTLVGLATIEGTLSLENGAALTTSASLNGSGQINLDDAAGAGGSSLTIQGELKSKTLVIGNSGLSTTDTLSAQGLDTSGTAGAESITLVGNASNNNTAQLLVSGGAQIGSVANHISDSTNISLSNHALLEFQGGGEITTIDAGSSLTLRGAAFVADSSDPSYSSALTGLATNAGILDLENLGLSWATSGALNNTGLLKMDAASGAGSSQTTIDGNLDNFGKFVLGNNALSAASIFYVNGAFINVDGNLTLSGNSSTSANQAQLQIRGGSGAEIGTAKGLLDGAVTLNGSSLINFTAGGQITEIASDGSLTLNGARAFIADAGSLTSNSALQSLASNFGAFTLENGAGVTITGALTNDGAIHVGANPSGTGATVLTITGALTNNGDGSLTIGDASSTANVQAASLENQGTIVLNPTSMTATLSIVGVANNDGSVTIGAGAMVSAGSYISNDSTLVSGTLSSSNVAAHFGVLEIASGGSVAVNGVSSVISLSDQGELKLDSTTLGGTFANLLNVVSGSQIDLAGMKFVAGASASISSGVLTVKSGSTTQAFNLGGSSLPSVASVSDDSLGGSLVTLSSYSNVATPAELNADIQAINEASQSSSVSGMNAKITLANETFFLNAALEPIELKGSDTLTIDGNGDAIDGQGQPHGLVVSSGKLILQNLTLQNFATGGGVELEGGALEISAQGTAGASAAIDYTSAASLQIDAPISANGTFDYALANFLKDDSLDLIGLPFANASLKLSGQTLSVTSDGFSEIFNLLGDNAAAYQIASDGGSGTLVTTATPPAETVAQYLANPAQYNTYSGVDIRDAAAAIAAHFDALNANPQLAQITLTDAGTPVLALTVAQALDDTLAIHAITNSPYDLVIKDTSAHLHAVTAAKIAALAAEGVSELISTDASVTYGFQPSAAIVDDSLIVSAPANDFARESFSATSSVVYDFNAGDVLYKRVTTISSGAFDDYFYNASGDFNGVSYQSYDTAFAAAGSRNAATYYSSPTSPIAADEVANETFSGNGGWTIYLNGNEFKQRNVQIGGAFDVHYFAGSASFNGATYTNYDFAFTSSGSRDGATYYSADGSAELAAQISNADGTLENEIFGVPNQTYQSFQNDLSKSGTQLIHSFDNDGGASGQVNVIGSGLTISNAAGTIGPPAAPNDFVFTPHATQTYSFQTNATNDVVKFASNFGAVTVKGFANANTASDILNVSSLFLNQTAAMSAVQLVNGVETIVVDASDAITINGVGSISLTAKQLGY